MRRRTILFVALWLGGCHLLFPYEERPDGAPPAPDLDATADARPDSARDAAADGHPDTSRDAKTPPDAPKPDALPPLPTKKSFCTKDRWCWMNPWPQGNDLYGLWRKGPHTVAVGDHGTILYHDGAKWQAMESHTTANLRGVWGASSTLIMAVGDKGAVARKAAPWVEEDSGTNDDLTGLWVSPAGEAFAVGDRGVILRREP